jgi:hypothetical protein
MSDVTAAPTRAELDDAFGRGRNYSRHCAQLAAGEPITCSGCALDDRLPGRRGRSDLAGAGESAESRDGIPASSGVPNDHGAPHRAPARGSSPSADRGPSRPAAALPPGVAAGSFQSRAAT